MGDKPWKRTERAVARMIGGTRVPVTGRQRGDAKDIEHPWLSVEVKHRAKPPGWSFLWDAMDQAIQSSNTGDLPVVVVHKTRVPHNKNMVVMLMEDFVSWFVEGINDELKSKWERLSNGTDGVPRYEETEDVLEGDSPRERAGLPRVVSPDGKIKRRIARRASKLLTDSGRRARPLLGKQEGNSN